MNCGVERRLYELRKRKDSLISRLDSLRNDPKTEEVNRVKSLLRGLFDVRIRIRNLTRFKRNVDSEEDKCDDTMDRDVIHSEDKSQMKVANSKDIQEIIISQDFSQLKLVLGEDADFEPLDLNLNVHTKETQCSSDQKPSPISTRMVLSRSGRILYHPDVARNPLQDVEQSRRQDVAVGGQFASVGDETGDWICCSPGCRWSNYTLRKYCLKCQGPRMAVIKNVQSHTDSLPVSSMLKSPDNVPTKANSKHGINFSNNNLDRFRFEEGSSPLTGDFGSSKSHTTGLLDENQMLETCNQLNPKVVTNRSELTPIKSELTTANGQFTSIKPKLWSPLSVPGSITPRRLSFTDPDSKDPCKSPGSECCTCVLMLAKSCPRHPAMNHILDQTKSCSENTATTRTKKLIV